MLSLLLRAQVHHIRMYNRLRPVDRGSKASAPPSRSSKFRCTLSTSSSSPYQLPGKRNSSPATNIRESPHHSLRPPTLVRPSHSQGADSNPAGLASAPITSSAAERKLLLHVLATDKDISVPSSVHHSPKDTDESPSEASKVSFARAHDLQPARPSEQPNQQTIKKE